MNPDGSLPFLAGQPALSTMLIVVIVFLAAFAVHSLSRPVIKGADRMIGGAVPAVLISAFLFSQGRWWFVAMLIVAGALGHFASVFLWRRFKGSRSELPPAR